jgi:hypothetical protein
MSEAASTSTTAGSLVLTDTAMRAYLIRCVDHVGGQQALARYLSQRLGATVSQREISQAVNGQRPVSNRLAVALGFYRAVQPRRVVYQQMQRAASNQGS